MVDGDLSAPDGPDVFGGVGGELLQAAACRPAASTAAIVLGGLKFAPFTDEFHAARGRAGPPGATAGMMVAVGGPTGRGGMRLELYVFMPICR